MKRCSPEAILDETYRLLHAGWIQGSNAAKADGEICSPFDPDAIAFCLFGAAMRAAYNLDALARKDDRGYEIARDRLMAHVGGHLWVVNDKRGQTHRGVLDVIDAVRRKDCK